MNLQAKRQVFGSRGKIIAGKFPQETVRSLMAASLKRKNDESEARMKRRKARQK